MASGKNIYGNCLSCNEPKTKTPEKSCFCCKYSLLSACLPCSARNYSNVSNVAQNTTTALLCDKCIIDHNESTQNLITDEDEEMYASAGDTETSSDDDISSFSSISEDEDENENDDAESDSDDDDDIDEYESQMDDDDNINKNTTQKKNLQTPYETTQSLRQNNMPDSVSNHMVIDEDSETSQVQKKQNVPNPPNSTHLPDQKKPESKHSTTNFQPLETQSSLTILKKPSQNNTIQTLGNNKNSSNLGGISVPIKPPRRLSNYKCSDSDGENET